MKLPVKFHLKPLNVLLLFSSLIGYLEWGLGYSTFLYQAEMDVFAKLFTDPLSVMHPFVLLPLLGQILLVITLFQREVSRFLTFTGIGCIGLLMLLILLVGILGHHIRVILSALPFIGLAVWSIVMHVRLRKSDGI